MLLEGAVGRSQVVGSTSKKKKFKKYRRAHGGGEGNSAGGKLEPERGEFRS